MAFDEMDQGDGAVRAPYETYRAWLNRAPEDLLSRRHAQADMLFRRIGITFAVYGDASGGERLIPFDVIPRILSRDEWKVLSRGVCQRIDALNRFIHDVYHDQEILRAGRVPTDLVLANELYREEMRGFTPPGGVYVHIGGIDVVRTG